VAVYLSKYATALGHRLFQSSGKTETAAGGQVTVSLPEKSRFAPHFAVAQSTQWFALLSRATLALQSRGCLGQSVIPALHFYFALWNLLSGQSSHQ